MKAYILISLVPGLEANTITQISALPGVSVAGMWWCRSRPKIYLISPGWSSTKFAGCKESKPRKP
jgi:hypothetical protein